ncbi:T9SS type A sorting domain-containing protein [Kordia sp.]|uniref:T9SS type A sorting domain-containing protein n=1 Tax=Kordia sp. TaxID=1965332 RepID=UPI0025BD66E9|nr:T9SS type A sorting domain-containing protein [Kordia sp.]MCH2196327.1 T9SS type A sorting domain-containing protein [Kordia sp.]
MIKKILFVLLLSITIQLQAQSLVNDGAEIMLQESALIYSTESFANRNNGQIKGDGIMDFSVARNFAIINPGVVIGDLGFNSTLSNSPNAGFMLDIQGNAGIGIENGHDHVFIDGDLVTNGVLDIATIDGFIPATTDSFTIISYTGNLSGQFTNVNLGANLSNFALDYTLPGQIRLVHQSVLSTEEATIESLQVFPNPTNDIIYIRSLDKIDKVEIYNLLGNQVLVTTKTDKVDLGLLAKGMYLAKIYSAEKFSVKKIKVQ